VVLEGGTYKIRTIDVDRNSFCNDSKADYLAIDLNHDGILDCTLEPLNEGFVWQEPFLINDQMYRVTSVSVPGDKVIIEKAFPQNSSQISCKVGDDRIASFTVTGKVTPSTPGSYVNDLYTHTDGTIIRRTAIVDSNGNFQDKPSIAHTGTWTTRASWVGNRTFECASTQLLTIHVGLQGDVNGDGTVDRSDAALLVSAYNSRSIDSTWNANTDLNADGTIDIYDAILLANNFGKKL
jgi:hypothetical protein